jgi:hypothetical protein
VRTGLQQEALNLKQSTLLNPACHALNLLPHRSDDTVLVSEQLLNSHQSFRAEIIAIQGRSVVRIGRWRLTAAGPQRTGQVFEFGAHRTADIARMISEVQRHLELDGGVK